MNSNGEKTWDKEEVLVLVVVVAASSRAAMAAAAAMVAAAEEKNTRWWQQASDDTYLRLMQGHPQDLRPLLQEALLQALAAEVLECH